MAERVVRLDIRSDLPVSWFWSTGVHSGVRARMFALGFDAANLHRSAGREQENYVGAMERSRVAAGRR